MIEATSKGIGKGDTYILEKLKEKHKKVILIINKIDLVEKESLFKIIEEYSKQYDFSSVIPIKQQKASMLKQF